MTCLKNYEMVFLVIVVAILQVLLPNVYCNAVNMN